MEGSKVAINIFYQNSLLSLYVIFIAKFSLIQVPFLDSLHHPNSDKLCSIGNFKASKDEERTLFKNPTSQNKWIQHNEGIREKVFQGFLSARFPGFILPKSFNVLLEASCVSFDI